MKCGKPYCVCVGQCFAQLSPLPDVALVASPAAPQAEYQQHPPCQGMNCGSTTGYNHSLECIAEHFASIAGGQFYKQIGLDKQIAALESENADWGNEIGMLKSKCSALEAELAAVRTQEKQYK